MRWCRNRTYSKTDKELTFETWKESIKTGNTFVTQGPLLEFFVNGFPAGSVINLQKNDEVEIDWECKTARGVLTKVQLISGRNNGGQIIDESIRSKEGGEGKFSFKVKESTWVAILTRGIKAAGTGGCNKRNTDSLPRLGGA